jgi:hypothetical protein
MSIAIKRYSDGSYIPLTKPWVRRFTVDNSNGSTPAQPKKKSFVRRAVSKFLDNAANGLLRSLGDKPRY